MLSPCNITERPLLGRIKGFREHIRASNPTAFVMVSSTTANRQGRYSKEMYTLFSQSEFARILDLALKGLKV